MGTIQNSSHKKLSKGKVLMLFLESRNKKNLDDQITGYTELSEQ